MTAHPWVFVFFLFPALGLLARIFSIVQDRLERKGVSVAAWAVSWAGLVITVLAGVVLGYPDKQVAVTAPLLLATGALWQLLGVVNRNGRSNEKWLSPGDRDQFESLGWSLILAGSGAAVVHALS